jgi:hypothetical protein
MCFVQLSESKAIPFISTALSSILSVQKEQHFYVLFSQNTLFKQIRSNAAENTAQRIKIRMNVAISIFTTTTGHKDRGPAVAYQ